MPKSRYIFAKLIKCEQCNYNYRGQNTHGKNTYLCNGYSMGKRSKNGCTIRYFINESELIKIVQIFCNRNKIEMELTNNFMKTIIEQIKVNRETDKITIYYKNGEKVTYSNNYVQI